MSKVECRQKAGSRVCCESSSSCSLASCALLKGRAGAGRTPAPRIRWSDEGDLATSSNPPVIQSLSKPARGSGHCLGTGGTKVNKPSPVPWATTGREDHTVTLLHARLFGAPEVLSGAPARGGSALWWQPRMLRGPPSPAWEGLGILETDALEEGVCAETQSVTEARRGVRGGPRAAVTKPREPCPATQEPPCIDSASPLLIARPMGGGNLVSSKLS